MTRDELSIEYTRRLPLYNRALKNAVQALEIFLQENKIMYLSISGRVKDFESFAEKTERKNYSNPFEDNEDFCGVRIIGYYLKDLEIIQEIIEREFIVISSIDKTAQLSTDQFGYRSNHFIIKIKDEWLTAPNYRGLKEIKLEIQLRTILMHAWAEIEHKLAYKNKASVPKEFQRELSWLSAKFEESDDQFQKLKDNIEAYRDSIKLSVESHGSIPKRSQLNYDSLTALLDYYLPGYPRNKPNAINLLERLKREQLSIAQTEELLKKIRLYAERLNNEVFPNKKLHLTQATILSYADDIFNSYDPNSIYSDNRRNVVERFKIIIQEDKSQNL